MTQESICDCHPRKLPIYKKRLKGKPPKMLKTDSVG